MVHNLQSVGNQLKTILWLFKKKTCQLMFKTSLNYYTVVTLGLRKMI